MWCCYSLLTRSSPDLEKPIVTFEVGTRAGTTSTYTSASILSAAVILPSASSPSYALISSSCVAPFIVARRYSRGDGFWTIVFRMPVTRKCSLKDGNKSLCGVVFLKEHVYIPCSFRFRFTSIWSAT